MSLFRGMMQHIVWTWAVWFYLIKKGKSCCQGCICRGTRELCPKEQKKNDGEYHI